jgi:hypothetical protein
MEAEEKAEQWFDKVVIKCGDDYFAKPDPKNKSLLFQLKNPYYDLKELKKTYTESDRLNGEVYEWYGAVDVHSTQYRQILPGEQGRWSEGTVTVYGTPFISKVLSKKNGQWNVDAETGSKFDCSDIPQ